MIHNKFAIAVENSGIYQWFSAFSDLWTGILVPGRSVQVTVYKNNYY
jgi:hypothetical protein